MRGLAWVVAFFVLPAAQTATAGEWTKFTVSNTSGGMSEAGAKVSGVLDDRHGTRLADLVVICGGDRTRVFMSADYLVFGGDIARVEYTIDNGPLQRGYWNVCAGDLCAGLWGNMGIQFVRSFLDASTLKLSLTRHFGEPIQAMFPVRGARDAVKEVGVRCGWMPP